MTQFKQVHFHFHSTGKFSYYQFESTNGVLGPVFFFCFNIFVNWIIMNMFISILNDVLVEVHTDAKLQDNDYEMVDYMIDSVKSKFYSTIYFIERLR